MHIKPKKSLGQNFLIDPNIRRKIAVACQLKPNDIVLEIGSGKGELTQLLAQCAAKVYAIEIDKKLCALLEEKFRGCPKVKVIRKDILNVSFKAYAAASACKIKVIGNIPYYITTPIILRLIKQRFYLGEAFLMLQKEFAGRAIAAAGSKNYGAFSCLLQYYCRPEIAFSVKRGSFFPAPKVDSSFLKLDFSFPSQAQAKDEEYLFRIIRSAFQQRRKMLKNSLQGVVPQQKLDIFFNNYKINNKSRPQDLSLKEFAALSNI